MAKITKADLEAKIQAQEALIKALEKSSKSSKKVTKKVTKSSVIVADGFHQLKRINSLTGGKDIRIQAITKDGKISGFFIANLYKGYDGRAKGAHIPVDTLDIVFTEMQKATIKSLEA